MTVSIKDVQVGKFFVCDYMVREISRDEGDGNVYYYTYMLETGESIHETSNMCSIRQITRRADREATPEEMARMKKHDARRSESSFYNRLGQAALRELPDQMLLDEVKRRGLSIPE